MIPKRNPKVANWQDEMVTTESVLSSYVSACSQKNKKKNLQTVPTVAETINPYSSVFSPVSRNVLFFTTNPNVTPSIGPCNKNSGENYAVNSI